MHAPPAAGRNLPIPVQSYRIFRASKSLVKYMLILRARAACVEILSAKAVQRTSPQITPFRIGAIRRLGLNSSNKLLLCNSDMASEYVAHYSNKPSHFTLHMERFWDSHLNNPAILGRVSPVSRRVVGARAIVGR